MVPQRGGSVNNGGAKETKEEFALDVFGLAEMLQMGVNCNLLGPREIRANGRREKRGSAGAIWFRFLETFSAFGPLYRFVLGGGGRENEKEVLRRRHTDL